MPSLHNLLSFLGFYPTLSIHHPHHHLKDFLMAELTGVKDSLTTLETTLTSGLTAIQSDVDRLIAKIAAAAPITQEDLDALQARLAALTATVTSTVTTVGDKSTAALG